MDYLRAVVLTVSGFRITCRLVILLIAGSVCLSTWNSAHIFPSALFLIIKDVC
jgi:hypothetical protein